MFNASHRKSRILFFVVVVSFVVSFIITLLVAVNVGNVVAVAVLVSHNKQ